MTQGRREVYPQDATAFARDVGLTIARRREEKNWSQFALASRAGLHQTTLKRIETGAACPNVSQLYVIAHTLQLTVVDLVCVDKSD